MSEGIRLVESAIHDHLLNPVPADHCNAVALLPGSVRRQVDRPMNPQSLTGIGNALGVIARRGAHDAAFALNGGQGAHTGESTTNLERAAPLLVFTLEKNFNPGVLTKSRGRGELGLMHDPAKDGSGVLNILGSRSRCGPGCGRITHLLLLQRSKRPQTLQESSGLFAEPGGALSP